MTRDTHPPEARGLAWWLGWELANSSPQTAELNGRHYYSDSCPCRGCSRARRRQLETRTGQATDQGSR